MSWEKYLDLDPHNRLRNEGRELLGRINLLLEKRDGENVSNWLNDEDEHRVSSRNMAVCETDIENRMKTTPEYSKIEEYLRDEKDMWNRPHLTAYGELLKAVSPTRLEPKRKIIHWILFDIYDADTKRFDSYEKVYQAGVNFGIPVVKCVDRFVPESLEQLDERINAALKWCGVHRREGVVGKVYGGEQVFYKEKRNIPKLPKIENPNAIRPEYPAMPSETIERALQHSIDEVGKDNWTKKEIAMPVLVKHLNVEGREHNYSVPREMYHIYLETLANDKYKSL